jgi:hypothetical protein
MTSFDYGIFVCLDVYSGKQDPYWKLSDEQIEQLKDKLKDLPETEMYIPGEYDHHGFRIYNKDKIHQLPRRIEVFHNVVSYLKDHKMVYFEDKNKIEEWLFDLAIDEGFGEIVRKVRD